MLSAFQVENRKKASKRTKQFINIHCFFYIIWYIKKQNYFEKIVFMQKDFLFSKKTFSPHQKTLLKLALSYGESKIYAPTTKQIAELANFLSLDTKDLLRALNENHHLCDGDKIIFAEDSAGDFIRSDYQLFHALLNLFFFKSSLNSVAKETNFSLKKFEFYQSCQSHLTNLNSSISTYECYKRSEYDYR